MALQTIGEGISAVERMYSFRNESEVREFLGQHPCALPLLVAARPEIERHFAPYYSRVAVVVEKDPEGHSPSELFAIIQCHLDAGEALDKLATFNRQWWAAASFAAHCPVYIDVEYAVQL